METEPTEPASSGWTPWNKERLVRPKPPLKLKEIWAIRIRLQIASRSRAPALFNLAVDSKLRGCGLLSLRVGDIAHGGQVVAQTTIVQQKSQHPVCFELTDQTRESIETWIDKAGLRPAQFLFPSRRPGPPHLSIRQ